MKKKGPWKKQKKPSAVSTFIGPDASIEGLLVFTGVTHLEGAVKGEIKSPEGTLIIGDSALVEASVVVDGAIIKGVIKGVVEAGTRIDVTGSAQVTGELYAPVISIDPGAVFNGSCGMEKPQPCPEKVLDSPKKPLTNY